MYFEACAEFPRNQLLPSYRKNILITCLKSRFLQGGGDVTVKNNGEHRSCIRDDVGATIVLRRFFAAGSLRRTKQSGCNVVWFRDADYSQLFAQVHFLFYITSDTVAKCEEEMTFVQSNEVTSAKNDIYGIYVFLLSYGETTLKKITVLILMFCLVFFRVNGTAHFHFLSSFLFII